MYFLFKKEEDIEKKLKENKKVILNFSADWCPPCQILEPLLKKIADDHKDIFFAKVDTDYFPKTTQEWQVKTLPTLVSINGNKEVKRLEGLSKKDVIEKFITESYK